MNARWRWLLILSLLASQIAGRCANTEDSFEQGIEACRSGRFGEATSAFQKSLAGNPSSGTLVNLGIAQWQNGNTGPAILSWERALWIEPGNGAAHGNLHFAREIAQLDSPDLTWYEAASTWLSANVWAWIACASFWIAVGTMTLPYVFRMRKSAAHQALAAVGLAVFLLTVPAQIGIATRSKIGFVLDRKISLRLTPTADAEVVSTLLSGEPARVALVRGDYLFIRTQTGSGWVKREQFGLVCPPENKFGGEKL